MHRIALLVLLAVSTTFVPSVRANHPAAAIHEVYSEGEATKDARWLPLKDLNGHFPMEVPGSLDAWETRAEALKRRILVSSGNWPLPDRTPLNAVIYDQTARDGFTVEKVFFESVPGNFVTGLLFRPEGEQETRKPAVLCPHGHGGRLQDRGEAGVRQAIADGFERFEESGRFPAMARCAQLARMGCVTFFYDMIGYTDNQQISFEVAHRAAQRRPEMEGTDQWGFYSPMAESRLQSIMGLQTWNSIRALDFLVSLPDVDPQRIGVTGNSGGGTQTLILCAIDSRPIVAFPNGMVSTSMQGGCYCENASLLRVGTGNVELTALFAPKPMAMTAVDDWTRDMMTDGYPQLQQLYRMYGNPDEVLCRSYPHFPHNYNYVTRCLMYSFFNRHMQLGLPEPIVEEDYRLLTAEEHSVWTDQHPAPEGGPEFERRLLGEMADRSDAQLEALHNQDPEQYRQTVTGALRTIVGADAQQEGPISWTDRGTSSIGSVTVEKGTIEAEVGGAAIPSLLIHPSSSQSPERVVILMNGAAKSGLFTDAGQPSDRVKSELEADHWVVGLDLFAAGENLTEEAGPQTQRRVQDDRAYAAFTYGYNPTRFARRVEDLRMVTRLIQQRFPEAPIDLVAGGGSGAVGAVARAIIGSTIERAEIDTQGFRFADVDSVWDNDFMPGAVKYGDLPAILAVNAPNALIIRGESAPLKIVDTIYASTSTPSEVSFK